MKTRILFSAFLLAATGLMAQIINPGNTLKRKVNERVNSKVDQTLDKGLDEAEEAAKKKKMQEDSVANANGGNPAPATTGNPGTGGTETVGFKTYSKYDFVSGEKIKALEDFGPDAIGDFPARWNTNTGGEVVNLEGQQGKWFQINKKGVFLPEFITELPENFTFEFDLAVNPGFSFYSSELHINFCALESPANYINWMPYAESAGGMVLTLHPTNGGSQAGYSNITYFKSVTREQTVHNNVTVNQLAAHQGKTVVHVSVWRQNQRVRVYVNEEKIWDIPRVFETGIQYNAIVFGMNDIADPNDKYLISNLKLAVGAPDTRHKLVTEGKFVSKGILFDVNSDKVKPQSYGSIKDIANVLKENPTLKIRITGHTDSDGDDKSNLELSRKRAEAVKEMLVKEFGIDASRIETDGKGESEPEDKSNTIEAKANNRRVEFVKIQ